MNTTKPWLILAIFSLAAISTALGQSQFRLTFRGTCYQTNNSGNVVATPLTEQTFLQDVAQRSGISTLAIVYHIHGSDFGDTVEVVNTSNGSVLFTLWGLFFGDDASLGRTAITNATGTEVRRVDYLYTLTASTYTTENTHSMGASFTTKRFLTDTSGTHTTIEGPVQWIANPQGTNGTKVCTGNFTTGQPLF